MGYQRLDTSARAGVAVTAKVLPDDLARLDELAERRGLRRGPMVRELILEAIDRPEPTSRGARAARQRLDGAEPGVCVTAKVLPDDLARLDELAERRGLRRGQLVRELIVSTVRATERTAS